MREHARVPAASGSWLVPEAIAGHRVGWFPAGLVFAEGHPAGEGLCGAPRLVGEGLALQEALMAAGVPLRASERAFRYAGPSSEGFAGVRRMDATVNVEFGARAEGLAVLAGIAAVGRDAPGKGVAYWGPDRGVQTVEFRGHGGRRILGRCYDKGIEAGEALRGRLVRIEDQRRWNKQDRPMPDDWTAQALRSAFHRRFYPLYKATRGVTVAGPIVMAERLLEVVERGELGAREAESLAGHMMMVAVGGRRGAGVSPATMYRREARARELGLVLADGVLQEVEVDVAEVLEAALDTDLWEAAG